MNRQFILTLALALAGCGLLPAAWAGDTPTLNLKPPQDDAGIAWQTRVEGDAVVVEFSDPTSRYRVEKVELVAPGGALRVAAAVNRTVERSYGYVPEGDPPPLGLGFAGHGVSFGHSTSLYTANRDSAPKTITRARMTPPDPAAYRAAPAAWTIAVELLDANGESSALVLPAPLP